MSNKFTEKKLKNPMTDRMETVYESEGLAKVTATNRGIECVGISIYNEDDLENFAQLISLSWQEHSRLKDTVRNSIIQ